MVSSVTPLMPDATLVQCCGSASRLRRSVSSTTWYSAGSSSSVVGTTPAFSNSTPLWTSIVASPPSSRIMLGPRVSASTQVIICSAHHQYSSSDSPFQAKHGTPLGSSAVPCGPTTTAAAAWSCVEKMLQEAQRTSAPSSTSVSMSTAVWTVMCSEPEMRAPCSGLTSEYSRRSAIRPGISCSASRISRRPKSASSRSATANSIPFFSANFSCVVPTAAMTPRRVGVNSVGRWSAGGVRVPGGGGRRAHSASREANQSTALHHPEAPLIVRSPAERGGHDVPLQRHSTGPSHTRCDLLPWHDTNTGRRGGQGGAHAATRPGTARRRSPRRRWPGRYDRDHADGMARDHSGP